MLGWVRYNLFGVGGRHGTVGRGRGRGVVVLRGAVVRDFQECNSSRTARALVGIKCVLCCNACAQ